MPLLFDDFLIEMDRKALFWIGTLFRKEFRKKYGRAKPEVALDERAHHTVHSIRARQQDAVRAVGLGVALDAPHLRVQVHASPLPDEALRQEDLDPSFGARLALSPR